MNKRQCLCSKETLPEKLLFVSNALSGLDVQEVDCTHLELVLVSSNPRGVCSQFGFADVSLSSASIPGLERSPGEGNGYPLQYSGLENSMAMDCMVHGVAKSQTRLSDFHFTSPHLFVFRDCSSIKFAQPPTSVGSELGEQTGKRKTSVCVVEGKEVIS